MAQFWHSIPLPRSSPTAWNEPYLPGTESQALAISTDGGITWEHYENNPILSDPPGNWNITGRRDPFYVPWPQLDTLLNKTEPHWYAVWALGFEESALVCRFIQLQLRI